MASSLSWLRSWHKCNRVRYGNKIPYRRAVIFSKNSAPYSLSKSDRTIATPVMLVAYVYTGLLCSAYIYSFAICINSLQKDQLRKSHHRIKQLLQMISWQMVLESTSMAKTYTHSTLQTEVTTLPMGDTFT